MGVRSSQSLGLILALGVNAWASFLPLCQNRTRVTFGLLIWFPSLIFFSNKNSLINPLIDTKFDKH